MRLSIIGMSGLLLDTGLTHEQHEYAETVRRSGDLLLGLINDILDFSKIEAGKLDLEIIDFDLRTCVEEIGDMLAQKAQEKGLELAILIYYDVPRRVKGDPGRLRQVLINLVNNAIKFTEKGEVLIRVSLASLENNSQIVKFDVIDTGTPSSRQGGASFRRGVLQPILPWQTERLGEAGQTDDSLDTAIGHGLRSDDD